MMYRRLRRKQSRNACLTLSKILERTFPGDEVSKRHLLINASTTEVFITGADREVVHLLNATVLCELSDGRTAERPLRVQVLDINDNGPRWNNQPVPHYREEHVKIDPDKLRKPLVSKRSISTVALMRPVSAAWCNSLLKIDHRMFFPFGRSIPP